MAPLSVAGIGLTVSFVPGFPYPATTNADGSTSDSCRYSSMLVALPLYRGSFILSTARAATGGPAELVLSSEGALPPISLWHRVHVPFPLKIFSPKATYESIVIPTSDISSSTGGIARIWGIQLEKPA